MPESAPVVIEVAAGAALVGAVLLNVFLAIRIAADVDRLREGGREPRFFGSVGWAFVTLILGLVALAFYWAVHYSTLRDSALDLNVSARQLERDPPA